MTTAEYNSDHTHISKLRVHEVGQEGKFSATKYKDLTRPQVVELIKKGKSFITILKDSNNKWSAGSKLEIIEVTTEYLKTENDKSTRDNLENLPSI